MNTEKKNQHYIPKFYLRNFSYKKNNNQIGIFNLKKDFFFQAAKLKTQGSKNFFYGYDGVIEDKLSEIEGDLSQTLKDIIVNKQLPKPNSKEHVDLLVFVALTDVRNPVRVENMKDMMNQMRNKVMEMDASADVETMIPTMSHDDVIKLSISNIPEITMNIIDLDYKLLINETINPFISSDYPVVKYNQYLEQKKWHHSKSGYSLTGLQIFIPLNSEIVLHFFDSGIYKVGDKKQKSLNIKSVKCVNEINKLQFINCLETIYFDENASEFYIKSLREKSLKHNRANIPESELSYIFKNGDDSKAIIDSGQKNLIVLGTSDCETNLKIEGIKIHSNGKAHKLNSTLSQMRKFPTRLHNLRNSH